ncbi:hypothetical protein [Phenylobacterium sp. SCN 70-31]|uniref:hypothetical protein n=1 Tax=Phenylobacterium sp. SCN 70-31 TaxID=1660129 RepID=UPI0025E9AFA2|nr:hypothetical protein [Phenylobacterium sp. SCN 70-31]
MKGVKGFQPGSSKPANSGMRKGQTTKKVAERSNAWSDQMALISRFTDECDGMTPAQICKHLGYNPLIYAIVMASSKTTPDAQKQKFNGDVLSRLLPTLGREDSNQNKTVRIIYEGFDHGRDDAVDVEAIEHRPGEIVPPLSGDSSGPLTMFDNPNESDSERDDS